MVTTLACEPNALGESNPFDSGDSFGPDAEDDAAEEVEDPAAVLPDEPPSPPQPARRLTAAAPARRPRGRRPER
jgi:hypothetical protein